MKAKPKNSRAKFLGAGLVVGGALYADPAAALATVGGRPIVMGAIPDTNGLPGNTKISTLVGSLPDNTGMMTLADLAGLASLHEEVIKKFYPKFSKLTFDDLSSIVDAVVKEQGGSTLLVTMGASGEYRMACCCCSCCCKFNF